MRISWVIGSFFPVAGGFFLALIFASLLKVRSAPAVYGLAAAASFAGGYLAARASRGKTVWEPALGAVLFIGSLLGAFFLTTIGKVALNTLASAEGEAARKHLYILAGVVFGGALFGASFGEFIQSGVRRGQQLFMAAFTFFAVLGGIFVALSGCLLFIMEEQTRAFFESLKTGSRQSGLNEEQRVRYILLALATGSFLGGFVSRRAGGKFAAIAFGALLTGGLFMPQAVRSGSDSVAGMAVLTGGIVICAAIGSLFGLIGLRQATAGAPPIEPRPIPQIKTNPENEFRLLVWSAATDGRVTRDEEDVLRGIAVRMGLPTSRAEAILQGAAGSGRGAFTPITDPQQKLAYLRRLAAVVAADGQIDPVERNLLLRTAPVMGLTEVEIQKELGAAVAAARRDMEGMD